jgi:hypothetical protein
LNSGDFTATGLILIDVYNKDYSYLKSMLEVRYHWQAPLGTWQLVLIPRLNLLHSAKRWKITTPWLGVALQRFYGQTQLSLGVNMLDAKDTLLLADDSYVITGRVDWPTWGNNRTAIGVNWHPTSAVGSSHFWFDFRIYFDHWFCVNCN